ncbi:MAG: thioredoxin domain-containing protein [Candidatus Marinimicrobia bacterium]|nr:thioredoxin domain-containing protein [Candidatus Neomarinimicrobiota bacterium]MCF7830114.1 thioredoxin domain-containing protein [Candidatus Neomarinimicrobiota bacterium]MCF7882483.1 thioredoxin domain-containing protein [Candidatus Neomarinimicrobiota bacterium]
MDQRTGKRTNRLADATSPYLREAADQPVHWYQWGEEAFQAAREQDKPILLDIGAVWCHWCHVIDRESYSEEEIAGIINEHFVAIKVDRDQRPDIDSRYQKAVQALSGQGGWPLTAFLTPEGEVFYGGTYFPPESQYGRPGMKELLPKVAQYYRQNKDEALENAAKIREHLSKEAESFKAGELSPQMLDSFAVNIRERYDSEHGGFGNKPKFPGTTALELAIHFWNNSGESEIRHLVTHTLTSMARGGFHDQLGGAFHRYSVDEEWHVPHFEVMSYVNSELLRLYAYGAQLFEDEYYRQVAENLVDYIMKKGADTRHGVFYASQDADYSMEDDGDYWTWTVEEVDAVLNEETATIIKEYYDIRNQGDMQENPAKNVLWIRKSPENIAEELGKEVETVESAIESGSRKLLEAREQRPEPFIDTTLYVDWNGMMAAGILEAGRILEREDLTELALKTLDRIWEEGWHRERGLVHRLGDTPGEDWGLLGDQVFYAKASLLAYELTGETGYLERAQQCLDYALEHLWNEEAGGFYDTATGNGDTLGFLDIRSQPIQDSPTPAENSIAALALQRYYLLSDNVHYHEKAEVTLKRFAESASRYGTFASTFGLAVSQVIREPLHILVIGDGESELWETAKREKYPLEVLQRVSDAEENEYIPEVAASAVRNLDSGKPVALICTATSCTAPISDVEEFRERLDEARSGG